MSIPYILLSILYILTCVALITVILLQKKRSAGLGGGMTGMGGGSGQTYWDKNKGRSFEGSLERYTKIIAIVLGFFTVLMCLIR